MRADRYLASLVACCILALATSSDAVAQSGSSYTEWIRPAKKMTNTNPGLRAETFDVPAGLQRIPSFDGMVPFNIASIPDLDFLGNRPNIGLNGKQPFAARFTGWFIAPATATFEFELASDDGSRLVVDGTTVIDNDGAHALRYRRGSIALAKGHHEIRIEHFNSSAAWNLSLRWRTSEAPNLSKLAGAVAEGGVLHPDDREFETALEDAKAAFRIGKLEELDRIAARMVVLNPDRCEGHAMLAITKLWRGDVGAAEEQFARARRFADPGMLEWISDLKEQPAPNPQRSDQSRNSDGTGASERMDGTSGRSPELLELGALVARSKLDDESRRSWEVADRLCNQFFTSAESIGRTKLGAQCLEKLAELCVARPEFVPAWIRRVEMAAALGVVTVGSCTGNVLRVLNDRLPNTPDEEPSRTAIAHAMANVERLGWSGPQTKFELLPGSRPLVISVGGQTFIADVGGTVRAIADAKAGHPRAAIIASLYMCAPAQLELDWLRRNGSIEPQTEFTVRFEDYRPFAIQTAILARMAEVESATAESMPQPDAGGRRTKDRKNLVPLAYPSPKEWSGEALQLRAAAAKAGDPVALYVDALSNPAPPEALSTIIANPPLQNVPALAEFKQLEVGSDYAIGVTVHGNVRTWLLGNSRGFRWNSRESLTPPADLGVVVDIAAGNDHCLALTPDGAVRAWGGQDNPNCVVPPDLGNVRDVAAGPTWSLAIRSDDTLACWGVPERDQALRPPADLGPVRAVRCDANSVIAIRKDGTLRLWGARKKAGTTLPRAEESNGFVDVAGGEDGGCAITPNGRIEVWRYGSAATAEGPLPVPFEKVRQLVYDGAPRLIDTDGNEWVAQLPRKQPVSWAKSADLPPIRLIGTQFGRAFCYCGVSTESDLRERRKELLTATIEPLRRSATLGFPPASQALADVLVLLGEREAALEELERAIGLANHPDVRDRLSLIAAAWRECLASGLPLTPTGAHESFGGRTEIREPMDLYTLQGRPIP